MISMPMQMAIALAQKDGTTVGAVLTREIEDVVHGCDEVFGHASRRPCCYCGSGAARDPANAHLIPHVEAMRQAFEHDYGVPIPPRTS